MHVLIIVLCTVKNFYNNYAVNKIKSVYNIRQSIYVFIILFEKRFICKLVTPGPILSCQLSIKRLFFMSDISSMATVLTVNNRRLSR